MLLCNCYLSTLPFPKGLVIIYKATCDRSLGGGVLIEPLEPPLVQSHRELSKRICSEDYSNAAQQGSEKMFILYVIAVFPITFDQLHTHMLK